MDIKIRSQAFKRGYGERVPDFSQDEIKNEPMLFNCDLQGALSNGGPITHRVLQELPSDWREVPLVIDSRVHMLMLGWYPCIPGWHHDDVPRTRADKQPNYAPGQDRSEHLILLLNGQIAPTRFALGYSTFKEPELGRAIYSDWNAEVDRQIKAGVLKAVDAPSNVFIKMNDRTWHTGTAAVGNGWRFFIRISRYFDKDKKPIARRNPRTNEVRRQVQVYLDNVTAGW